MSQHDDIDDARALLIDQRIGQAFGFLGDVIEDTRLLDAIPDGSRLAFRDVTIGEFHVRLTAYQPPSARDQWKALVTSYQRADSQVESDARQPPKSNVPRGESSVGKTAALALDALEAELRSLVTLPA